MKKSKGAKAPTKSKRTNSNSKKPKSKSHKWALIYSEPGMGKSYGLTKFLRDWLEKK